MPSIATTCRRRKKSRAALRAVAMTRSVPASCCRRTATVFTGKVELGQGILTALWQIAAEELDLPLSRVTILQVDTSRSPNEGFTFGSQSIENSGVALRLAGAEARAILIELAAKKLGVAADTLKVRSEEHPSELQSR